MNIIEQVKNIFGGKANRKRRLILWPTWREGVSRWQLTDLTHFIAEGFEMNAVLYAAIMYKARAMASVPMLAYDQAGELLPPESELSKLIARPNRHYSWEELAENLAVYYNLMGEAYVYALRRNLSEPPEALYALRPDRVYHLYKDGELAGYEYVAAGATAGFTILPEDMLHWAMPNPGDVFEGFGKGFSPVFPVARSIDVDNDATDFLKEFFANGALPAGILKFDVPLDDNIVAQAQDRWAEVHGGYKRWTEPAVLDSGGSYQRIGLSIQELDMAALDARSESRVTMVLGVPLNLIESRPSLTQGTYSNKEQDRRMFWEDTMLAELRKLQREWQWLLNGDYGTVRYDFSAVPALESARREGAAQYLNAYMQSAVTTNELREALGLPPDPRGPLFLYPFGVQLVPAFESGATTAESQGEDATAQDEDREDAKSIKKKALANAVLTTEQKALLWKRIDATARAYEDDAARATRRAFERDHRAIRAILDGGQKSAYQQKASVAWQMLLLEVQDYLKMAGKDNWRKELLPVMEAVIGAQGEHLSATFGMSFNVRNLLAEDWFKEYELTFTDPITATTEETLSKMFNQAMAEGWSIPDMEKSLDTLFTQWAYGGVTDPQDRYFAEQRLPPNRVELVARTETMRASNAGGFQLYKDWGVTRKEWLATGDNRTRDSHRVGAVWGQAPLVANIDEPFTIGGVPMMYPGDPSAPIHEFANCRCTTVPVFEE